MLMYHVPVANWPCESLIYDYFDNCLFLAIKLEDFGSLLRELPLVI